MKGYKEVDEFFIENILNDEQTDSLHELSIDISDVYIKILSKHLELSYVDTHHLSVEMTRHAVSAFLDIAVRLTIAKKINTESAINMERSHFYEELRRYFNQENFKCDLASSRVFRCRTANLIMCSLGISKLFDDNLPEKKRIYLDELNIPVTKEMWRWRFHNFIRFRFANIVTQNYKVFFNKILQIFRPPVIRTGYISLDSKYMTQLPDIDWFQLKFNLDSFVKDDSAIERYNLYSNIKEEFISNIGILSSCELITGNKNITNEFASVLLSVIVVKSEVLLTQKNNLHAAINFSKELLLNNNIQIMYGNGNWFRFKNAVLAVAARKIDVPVVEFRAGGSPMYRLGKGFDIGCAGSLNNHVDFYMSSGDFLSKEDAADIKYLQTPNPRLYQYKNRYNYSNIKKKCINILYSPIAFSVLYPVEHRLPMGQNKVIRHRKVEKEIFQYLDDSVADIKINLFIKVKGFGCSLFEKYSEFLFPELKLNNIQVSYITLGDAEEYFNYMDMHCFTGPSTTFSKSVNFGIPSICLWDTNLFKVKEIYRKLFDDMRDIGLICTNKFSFVNQIKSIVNTEEYYDSLNSDVIEKFNYLFSYTSSDWKQDINKQMKFVFSNMRDVK